MHKAGFVNIVGNPNVGKSTLMNSLVGERISIITSKAQTTRHRIMGIVNTEDMQIVYSDTPGVLVPNYKLQESMLNFSTSALTDADVVGITRCRYFALCDRCGGSSCEKPIVPRQGGSGDGFCIGSYQQGRFAERAERS